MNIYRTVSFVTVTLRDPVQFVFPAGKDQVKAQNTNKEKETNKTSKIVTHGIIAQNRTQIEHIV